MLNFFTQDYMKKLNIICIIFTPIANLSIIVSDRSNHLVSGFLPVPCLSMLSLCTNCLIIRIRSSVQHLHSSSVFLYREDYVKLGLPETATKEDIKAAYFQKAKLLHPDSYGNTTKSTEKEFLELNEAYKRLIYESKHGTDSFDQTDPRNDPRTREYWEIRRKAPQTEAEINLEKLFNRKGRDKEKKLIRYAMIGLAIGVFLGTIYPALFLGADTESYYRSGCQCDSCLIGEIFC